jgi:hypothetical protein
MTVRRHRTHVPYSIRMETFLRSEEQGVDAFGLVVGSLVGGAAAGEVEAFSEAVSPQSHPSALPSRPDGRLASRLSAGQPPVVAQRVLDGLLGRSHARACLLDHAAQLRDVLGELLADEEVGVEVAEETLEQAARVWTVGLGS